MCTGWKMIFIMATALALMVMGSGVALATWTITDMGSLTDGDIMRNASAINNQGQVVGNAYDSSFTQHAFLWSAAEGIHDLGDLGGGKADAKGINNLGQVVGSSYPTGGARAHASLWISGEGWHDLGTLTGLSTDGSAATDINESGHIAGQSYYSGGGSNSHAFFYQDGFMLDIGALNGMARSYANAINNSDQVVGYSYYADGQTNYHAFIWDSVNGMRDLGTLTVQDETTGASRATDINDAGEVVGYSDYYDANNGNSNQRAVIWKDGVIQGLDFLPTGKSSQASGINNTGQIAGYATIINGSAFDHACIWSDGRTIDLNDIFAGDGWDLRRATKINDEGQIIGSGLYSAVYGNDTRMVMITQNLKVTAFIMASATADNQTVPVVSFQGTDSVGVTGYMITESDSAPAADDYGWSAAPPTEFTYTTAGNSAYAWVKDAQGNVSFGVKASAPATADNTAPTVTAFTVPATSTSLTVAINTFTASDDTGVTGYMVTESNTPPAADDAGWSASAPTEYTFADYGAKVLYAWAKDAAGNVSVSVSANVVVEKATATVTLGNITATYDGTPKAVTATTDPQGLAVDITYDGSATTPTNAGSYAVVATVNDANYQGTASGTLVIGKATATVTLDSLNATYDGQPKAATATTDPQGLAVVITYDGLATVPTSVGSYAVVAAVNDANYQGTASGTFVIGKATATVTLDNLNATYDGTAKAATVTTNPAGLSFTITYDNSETAPTDVGSYAVAATINDANYQGTATGTLTISKMAAVITLHNLTAMYDGSPKQVTATTNPDGMSVTITYNGSPTPPSSMGSYTVVATVSTDTCQGTATGTLNIVEGDLVRIGTLAYPNLTSAIAAATTGTVLARSVTFEESPVITSATVLNGGYDSQFKSNSGNYTALSGTVTVSKGSLTVDKLVIM